MVCRRDTYEPMHLTRLSTCLPPSRSPTLAAVTSTRSTKPKVSTVRNRLRPLINFPASNPTDSLTARRTFDALTIDNRFGWTRCAVIVHSHPLAQTIMNAHPRSIFTPVAEICVNGLPVGEVGWQVTPSAPLRQDSRKWR